jgi:hypothetical protein
MNMTAPEPLETTRHSMYTRAERWWWGALACVVAGVAASTLLVRPLLPSGGMIESVVLVVSVVAPALAALARRRSAECAARAGLCRRAFLYRDALGEDLSVDERRIVALWPANTPLNRITTQAPYFASTEGAGATRLADAIGESAFYTAELARVMAVGGYVLSAVSALALLVGISAMTTLSLDAEALGHFKTVIGLVAIVMLTLITAEVLTTAMAYGTLAKESKEVFRSATQVRKLAPQNIVTAVRLSESYSVALAANIPIPNFVYRWHHERIDRAYSAGA